MQTPDKTEAARGAATLVVAQSPRYYPHVERHLNGLMKAFPRVRLLYWEKDPSEPLFSLPGVDCHRLVLPFGKGGTSFFLRLMAGFLFHLLKRRSGAGDGRETIEAIDPYALIPARLYALRQSLAGRAPRLVYFSMEYFSALPSLRAKPIKRRIWSALERWGARGCAAGATVCDSIAAHLRREFGIPIVTVRNVPYRNPAPAAFPAEAAALHTRCGLAAEAAILIYQGMLQEGRGLETAVRAMALVPGVHFAVIGGGPLLPGLRALARAGGCEERVHLLGEVDFRDLAVLTRGAFAGLAPFQALSASYLYSLPGKLFEYIQAGVPVIATALPEIRKVVDGYGVGICLEDERPETLGAALRRLLEEPGLRGGFLRNLPAAQADLCWEAEEARYLELYP